MTRKKLKTYHHGDLRNALINAAILLIREEGPNAISLREVAKRAGVSHTAPYRHFEDKQALLSAIAQNGFQQLGDAMADVANRFADDPGLQFVEAGRAYVQLAVQNPEITQLMFGGYIELERCSEALSEQADRAFDGLLVIIKNGQRTGVLPAGDSRPPALAAWSMAHGFAMLVTAGQLEEMFSGKKQIESLSRTLGKMLLHGLAVK